MPARAVPAELEVIRDPGRAAAILHPLRLRILHYARQPTSASEVAGWLELPRQRVNHHVRKLARTGLLLAAGRNRKRNMFEKLYVASARSYSLSPEILGPARADWREMPDPGAPHYLLALLGDAQMDLARALRQGGARPLEILSVKTQFRLRGAREREALARALRGALGEVVARHTEAPEVGGSGEALPGSLYRLVLACYPHAPETRAAVTPPARSGR